MKTIKQTYGINAPVEKVWQALTDPTVMDDWGGGPAEFEARVGGKFSQWGGDIYGTNTKIVPNKLLEQDWWSTSSSSKKPHKVSFALNEKDGKTTVKLTHANIPDGEEDDFADGWRDYYLGPIEALFV